MRYTFYLLLFIAYNTFSQEFISGALIDAESNEPIAYAHVILGDSSSGTFTDLDGNFILKYTQSLPSFILVSHVNYGLSTIPVKVASMGLVKLSVKEETLEEVRINGSVDKKWRREFKIFQATLFGSNEFAASCKILNPWVIDFSRTGGAFIASSDELLEISNEALGYKIKYRLREFFLKQELVMLKGDPIDFRDLSKTEFNTNYFEHNRRDAYEGSLSHFIYSINTNSIAQSGFEIYRVGKDLIDIRNHPLTNIVKSKVVETSDLLDVNNQMDFTGFLQIVYKDPLSKRIEISWLKKQGPVFVTEDGLLANPENLILHGSFSNERLAYYLPQDQILTYQNRRKKVESISKITDDLEAIETLHLHVGKSSFRSGEYVWFKAYANNGNEKSDLSKKLFAELVNSDSSYIQTITPITEGVSSGWLQIPANTPPGFYSLLAYTDYSKNKNENFHFKRAIQVGNPVSKTSTAKQNQATIRLFPEGGELVADVANKVAFEVSYADGFIDSGTIELFDQDSLKILTAEIYRYGKGTFTFQPEKGKKYFVKSEDFEIKPNAFSAGNSTIGIGVKKKEGFTSLDLKANTAYNDSLFVLVSSKNTPLSIESVYLEKYASIPIHNGIFMDGVNRITIFDSELNPLLERLVFARPDVPSSINLSIDRSSENLIEVQLLGEDSIRSASVSVVEWSNPYKLGDESILASTYLRPDVSGEILDVDLVFSDTEFAELVMLSNGWRKFKSRKEKTTKPAKTNGFTIRGRITSPKPGSLEGKAVYLIHSGSIRSLESTSIGANSDFLFENIIFSDSTELMFAFDKKVTKKIDSISVEVDHDWRYVDGSALKPFMYENGSSKEALVEYTAPTQDLETIELDEVIVRTVRKRNPTKTRPYLASAARILSFKDRPLRGSSATVISAIETGFAPVGAEVDYGGGPFPINITFVNSRKAFQSPSGSALNFYIDNVPHEPIALLYLDPKKIETIEFVENQGGHGALYIYTREEEGRQVEPQFFSEYLKGFQEKREFYLTKGIEGANVGMIHWDPDIDNAKRKFTFLKTTTTRPIRILVEGMTADGKPIRSSYELSPN